MANGEKKKRPSKLTKEQEEIIISLYNKCHIDEICNIAKVSRSQIYRVKEKYKDKLEDIQLMRHYSPEVQKRLEKSAYNKQGCLMKIVEYENANNIVVEFQDEYKAKVHTRYKCFEDGNVFNPYYKNVCGIGITGDSCPITINGNSTKEYNTWQNIIRRCYDEKYVINHPAYNGVTVCEEWLYYPNFYDWLHKQENFEQWLNNSRWAVDKDIINKGNKMYSPENCCLVPQSVNNLFTKSTAARGELPIGVNFRQKDNRYYAIVSKSREHNNKKFCPAGYPTPEDAFYFVYKPFKEKYIKERAEEEFEKGNITKRCYDAMMRYEVEITD